MHDACGRAQLRKKQPIDAGAGSRAPPRVRCQVTSREMYMYQDAAHLGAGILVAQMGPAHQKSDRRASSDALLAFSRRRGAPVCLVAHSIGSGARQERPQRPGRVRFVHCLS